MAHTPRSTDQVGTIDTSGVAPGPHADIKGVTTIFDIEAERQGYVPGRDVSDEDRISEKAVAAGSEEAQQATEPLPPHDRASHQIARVTEQTDDTTLTDVQSASARDHETVAAEQTDTWDTSETGGEPNADQTTPSGIEDGTSLTSDVPFTATEGASAEAKDETDPDEVDPEVSENAAALAKLSVGDLVRLARDAKVSVPKGRKDQMAAALDSLGVKAPADGKVPGPDDDSAPAAEETAEETTEAEAPAPEAQDAAPTL